jgi:hypothetical protein
MLMSSELKVDELPTSMEYIRTYLQFIAYYFGIFPSYFADVL